MQTSAQASATVWPPGSTLKQLQPSSKYFLTWLLSFQSIVLYLCIYHKAKEFIKPDGCLICECCALKQSFKQNDWYPSQLGHSFTLSLLRKAKKKGKIWNRAIPDVHFLVLQQLNSNTFLLPHRQVSLSLKNLEKPEVYFL